jgi:membrane protease YdiL (CAAX protease family)
VHPRNWVWTVASGVVLGIALKLVLKAIVMPLLGAPAINPVLPLPRRQPAGAPGHAVRGHRRAAFAEETVFPGCLFERLGKLLGRTIVAKTAIVLFTSALFGLIHYPGQGLAGAQQATITGLTFGTIFAVTGRLFMPIIAHSAFDVAAVLIIY